MDFVPTMGDLLYSRKSMLKRVKTGEDWQKMHPEVRLTDSTPSIGKLCTWGSGQQCNA